LWRVDGTDGVKTGYTKAAGRILVSSARRDGRRLICVTINDGNDWADHQLLLEDGFDRYTNKSIVCAGDVLGERAIVGGDTEKVQLIAAEDFSFALTAQEQPQIVLSGAEFDYAPVVQGADAGYAYVLLDEKTIGKVRVVYGQTVEQEKQPEKKPFWKRWFGGAS
jgi:D-alanyl-D-alanine carboxypeptidase